MLVLQNLGQSLRNFFYSILKFYQDIDINFGKMILILIFYYLTTASALQWKAFNASKEAQDVSLRMAESEAKQALELVIQHYGEVSLRTAQVYSLLGQVYSKMDRLVCKLCFINVTEYKFILLLQNNEWICGG